MIARVDWAGPELPPVEQVIRAAWKALSATTWSVTVNVGRVEAPPSTVWFEAAVGPDLELMHWRTEPAEADWESWVIFRDDFVLLYGEVAHGMLFGAALDAHTPKGQRYAQILDGRWVRSPGTPFRRRDHCYHPLGMVQKSIGDPTEEIRAAPIDLRQDGRGRILVADVVIGYATGRAEIAIDAAGPRLMRFRDRHGSFDFRHDEGSPQVPDIDEHLVLTAAEVRAAAKGAALRRRPDATAGNPRVAAQLLAPEEAGEDWAVLCGEELAAAFDVANCYEAEVCVCEHLASADPALLDRVRFDTEASMFAAYVGTADDARRLADHIAAATDRA
jgi:hypothetical protein